MSIHEWQPMLHPGLTKVYRRRTDQIQEALSDPAPRETLEILREVIDRVLMCPKLVGEIAKMMVLAANPTARNKKAAPTGRLFGKFPKRVIAGAGNQSTRERRPALRPRVARMSVRGRRKKPSAMAKALCQEGDDAQETLFDAAR